MAEPPYTSADFHSVVQKQILNALYETFAAGKLDWELVRPFLEAAREMCRADFREAGSVRFHVLRQEGEEWVSAEEAFLGISIADRDTNEDWLTETWWVSDIALAERDPDQVRLVVAALERSVAKLNAWLREQQTAQQMAQEEGGPADPE